MLLLLKLLESGHLVILIVVLGNLGLLDQVRRSIFVELLVWLNLCQNLNISVVVFNYLLLSHQFINLIQILNLILLLILTAKTLLKLILNCLSSLLIYLNIWLLHLLIHFLLLLLGIILGLRWLIIDNLGSRLRPMVVLENLRILNYLIDILNLVKLELIWISRVCGLKLLKYLFHIVVLMILLLIRHLVNLNLLVDLCHVLIGLNMLDVGK